jgi:hypothetical protein
MGQLAMMLRVLVRPIGPGLMHLYLLSNRLSRKESYILAMASIKLNAFSTKKSLGIKQSILSSGEARRRYAERVHVVRKMY